MKRLVLTSEEAAVLSAFGLNQEASMPELAATTKLSLSQIREGIDRLEQRGFACTSGHFVRLTQAGTQMQHSLKRNRATFFFV